MNQEDFRRLVNSAAASGLRMGQTSGDSSRGGSGSFSKPRPTKTKQAGSGGSGGAGGAGGSSGRQAGGGGGPKYRDRAKERREGLAPELDSPQAILEMLRKSMQADEPVQPEAVDRQEEPNDDELEAVAGSGTKPLVAAAGPGAGDAAKDTVEKAQHKSAPAMQEDEQARLYVEALHGDGGPVTTNDPALQHMFDLCLRVGQRGQPPLRNDMMSPGRMAFVWELGFDDKRTYFGSSDLPATIVRPKEQARAIAAAAAEAAAAVAPSHESSTVVSKLVTLFRALNSGDEATSSDAVRGLFDPLAGGSSTQKTATTKPPRKGMDLGRADDSDSDGDAGGADAEAIARIASARKLALLAKAARKDDDSGSDIYSDAGSDYVPEIKPSDKPSATMDIDPATSDDPASKKASYFAARSSVARASALADEEDDDTAGASDSLGPTTLSSLLRQGAGMVDTMQGVGAADRLVSSIAAAHGHTTSKQEAIAAAGTSRTSKKRSTAADVDEADDADADGETSGATRSRPLQGLSALDTYDTAFDYGAEAFDDDFVDDKARKGGKKRKGGADDDGDAAAGGGAGGGGKLNRDFQMLDNVYRKKFGSSLSAKDGDAAGPPKRQRDAGGAGASSAGSSGAASGAASGARKRRG
ncbi:hypothetical protein HK105_208451 [Polyrhizophydium stewartii]|uniref:RED-like N-terminal domain-containing protein n=1 Tax=Polyrhizophydium stewartii TaxID=2732419 RepID=A0ABR4MXV4_9FUNG